MELSHVQIHGECVAEPRSPGAAANVELSQGVPANMEPANVELSHAAPANLELANVELIHGAPANVELGNM